MQHTTSTTTAHAMPLPAGGFLPYVRCRRTTGTRTLGQTIKAGPPCPTAADALRLASVKAQALAAGASRPAA